MKAMHCRATSEDEMESFWSATVDLSGVSFSPGALECRELSPDSFGVRGTQAALGRKQMLS